MQVDGFGVKQQNGGTPPSVFKQILLLSRLRGGFRLAASHFVVCGPLASNILADESYRDPTSPRRRSTPKYGYPSLWFEGESVIVATAACFPLVMLSSHSMSAVRGPTYDQMRRETALPRPSNVGTRNRGTPPSVSTTILLLSRLRGLFPSLRLVQHEVE
jgi:hypothetical protein